MPDRIEVRRFTDDDVSWEARLYLPRARATGARNLDGAASPMIERETDTNLRLRLEAAGCYFEWPLSRDEVERFRRCRPEELARWMAAWRRDGPSAP